MLVDEGAKEESCRLLATAVTTGRADMNWKTPWVADVSAQVHFPGTVSRCATHKQQCTATSHGSMWVQVFDGLSADLVAAILRCIALPVCLTRLPRPVHPLALTAHVPGIESHGAVTLPPLSGGAMLAAGAAIAALPGVQRLDLQGHVLAPWGQWLWRLLRALPGLTALCLSDCTLRSPFDVLFRLTALQSLDLSHNWLPRDVLGHLRQLSALTCLNLVDSVTFDAVGEMRHLEQGINALPALANISLGALVTHDAGGWVAFRPALKRVLRALCAAPVLTSLDLRFGHVDVDSED